MSYPTPIYTSIRQHMANVGLRLHMPGHAGLMSNINPDLEVLAQLDWTELPGLDDLHNPQGIIAQAQQLMAQACGAGESYFLTNGATSGIHALLMSGSAAEKIILPRNSHRSFWGGLVLSGSIPVWVPGEVEPDLGIVLSSRPEAFAQALSIHPEAKVVWLTSPTYYGTCCDVSVVHRLLCRRDTLLMVDEAHGAHFPFHPLYPRPALMDGAAAVVNGLHKSWPVMTPGAALHLSRAFLGGFGSDSSEVSQPAHIERAHRLKSAYHLLTTTSPSYPLLACIDLARAFMEQEGHQHLEQARCLAAEYKTKLNHIRGIRCYGEELTTMPGVHAIDPLKVLIGVESLALTGVQIGAILRDEFGIEVEIAQPGLIVAMFSLLHTRSDWECFFRAVKDIAIRYPGTDKHRVPAKIPPEGPMELTPRQAFLAPKRKVRIEDSRNLVAGEMVAPYPPGIPCLLPGELITADVIEYISYIKTTRVHVQGPSDPNLEYILTID